MTTDDGTAPDPLLDVFVPLHEAAHTYDTTVAALRARARRGALRAYKVGGPHGREWRVSLRSLQTGGYGLRPVAPSPEARAQELEQQMSGLRRRLDHERRRADRADQELGLALLEAGRLRAALARATAAGADATGEPPEHPTGPVPVPPEHPTDPVLVPPGLVGAGAPAVPGLPGQRA